VRDTYCAIHNTGMKKNILSSCIICFSLMYSLAIAQERKVIKSEHVLVYDLDDKAFAKETSVEEIL